MSPPLDLPTHVVDAALALTGGRGRLPIVGRSMEPTLPDGSDILVDFSQRSFRPGDLVVFRQGPYVVVHRYLGPARSPDRRPCLRTRGDGLLTLDPACAPESVLGGVRQMRRGGVWWDLDTRPARSYSRAVAWHDLFWAAAGVLAERSFRGRGTAWQLARRADRALLRWVDALLFSRLHRRVGEPELR